MYHSLIFAKNELKLSKPLYYTSFDNFDLDIIEMSTDQLFLIT